MEDSFLQGAPPRNWIDFILVPNDVHKCVEEAIAANSDEVLVNLGHDIAQQISNAEKKLADSTSTDEVKLTQHVKIGKLTMFGVILCSHWNWNFKLIHHKIGYGAVRPAVFQLFSATWNSECVPEMFAENLLEKAENGLQFGSAILFARWILHCITFKQRSEQWKMPLNVTDESAPSSHAYPDSIEQLDGFLPGALQLLTKVCEEKFDKEYLITTARYVEFEQSEKMSVHYNNSSCSPVDFNYLHVQILFDFGAYYFSLKQFDLARKYFTLLISDISRIKPDPLKHCYTKFGEIQGFCTALKLNCPGVVVVKRNEMDDILNQIPTEQTAAYFLDANATKGVSLAERYSVEERAATENVFTVYAQLHSANMLHLLANDVQLYCSNKELQFFDRPENVAIFCLVLKKYIGNKKLLPVTLRNGLKYICEHVPALYESLNNCGMLSLLPEMKINKGQKSAIAMVDDDDDDDDSDDNDDDDVDDDEDEDDDNDDDDDDDEDDDDDDDDDNNNDDDDDDDDDDDVHDDEDEDDDDDDDDNDDDDDSDDDGVDDNHNDNDETEGAKVNFEKLFKDSAEETIDSPVAGKSEQEKNVNKYVGNDEGDSSLLADYFVQVVESDSPTEMKSRIAKMKLAKDALEKELNFESDLQESANCVKQGTTTNDDDDDDEIENGDDDDDDDDNDDDNNYDDDDGGDGDDGDGDTMQIDDQFPMVPAEILSSVSPFFEKLADEMNDELDSCFIYYAADRLHHLVYSGDIDECQVWIDAIAHTVIGEHPKYSLDISYEMLRQELICWHRLNRMHFDKEEQHFETVTNNLSVKVKSYIADSKCLPDQAKDLKILVICFLLNNRDWEFVLGMTVDTGQFSLAKVLAALCYEINQNGCSIMYFAGEVFDILISALGEPSTPKEESSFDSDKSSSSKKTSYAISRLEMIEILQLITEPTVTNVLLSFFCKLYSYISQTDFEICTIYNEMWPSDLENRMPKFDETFLIEAIETAWNNMESEQMNNTDSLIMFADYRLTRKEYSDAMKYYLLAIVLKTDHFTNDDMELILDRVADNMLTCLNQLNFHYAAFLFCQFLPLKSPSLQASLVNQSSSDPRDGYFEILWKQEFMELLCETSVRYHREAHSSAVLEQVKNPMMNSFNDDELRESIRTYRLTSFLIKLLHLFS
ncbi:Integrator complex subunit 8 [Trichinella murrelli]|uniref:Integrator complex subunit 8 n=1 Tax=Trichinella murrelli TaxID=144512 RepID=A0A0V0UEG4_9BILA|nr:Integrator complex subunit 8 [Trichinella murrelli]